MATNYIAAAVSGLTEDELATVVRAAIERAGGQIEPCYFAPDADTVADAVADAGSNFGALVDLSPYPPSIDGGA